MYNDTMQTAYVGSLVTILILHAIKQMLNRRLAVIKLFLYTNIESICPIARSLKTCKSDKNINCVFHLREKNMPGNDHLTEVKAC